MTALPDNPEILGALRDAGYDPQTREEAVRDLRELWGLDEESALQILTGEGDVDRR